MEEQNQEYKTERDSTTSEKKQTGSIIGSIIVIIIIIVGGLYFWGARTTNTENGETPVPVEETPVPDIIGDALRNASSSPEEVPPAEPVPPEPIGN